MTEAMPFLQKTILLSYDPRPFSGRHFLREEAGSNCWICRIAAKKETVWYLFRL